MTRRTAAIVLYALLAILVVPVYPHFLSPNEFSRWVLAVALVDEHTVEVTHVVQTTHTRTEDLAAIAGRLYSNKAPGATFVGIPAYAIAKLIAGDNMRATLNAMRLLASTVPAILLALWFANVANRFGASEEQTTFATIALLFATPLFAYGLLFFAHALSALTLFGAFALLFQDAVIPSREDGEESRTSVATHSRDSSRSAAPGMTQGVAGALLGLAVISEYPNAIPAAVLIACAIPRLRFGGTVRVILGGLPFAIALAIYNRIAFGSAFSLSSAHESDRFYRELATTGLFGIHFPSPVILFKLLVDPSRGLFFFSPVLLVAFFGLRAAYRTLPRGTFLALVGTPLSIVLTFSGYPNWHGGWTVGARYLVPALPFLALLAAFAKEHWIQPLLIGASVAGIGVVTLVFPFAALDFPAPWSSLAAPMLRDGHVMPNLLHLVWRPLAVVVPFAIVMAAVMTALTRRVLVVTGAVVWLLVTAPLARFGSRNLRAVIEEVYFQDPTAIARTLPRGDRNIAELEAIARRLERTPPDFWPY